MTAPAQPVSGPPLAGLREALTGSKWAGAELQPLADTGLAHWHVALGASGWLARVPKQSQMGLAAADNLAYQAACFRRAAAGGHAPMLQAVLPASAALPRGALLVQQVAGRPARLPQDLPALAQALAALHRLPLPAPGHRAPLHDPADPLAALAAEITQQAQHLDAAGLAPAARRRIRHELARWQVLCAAPARPPRGLIAFDAHPGNFLVRADGVAVLVDLEKARYGPAALDLAHATLFTSTTWDLASQADLTLDQVDGFYAAWQAAGGAAAEGHRPWWAPLRRAMWLWSVSWCAMWRVQSGRAPGAADGADWSSAHSDDALVQHVRGRVDLYLSPAGVDRVCDEADALAARWA